jgi:hypothetical protein
MGKVYSIKSILSEYNKRTGGTLSDSVRIEQILKGLYAPLVKEQRNFLLEKSRFAVASCPRQCGKTFTLARDLIGTCIETPNSEVMYIAITAAAARSIMWSASEDGIQSILPRIGLVEGKDYELHDSRMEVRFSNGSLLTLVGVDRADFNKLRGQKKDLIIVDEAQLQILLGTAVRSVLNYMLLARKGRLRLAGTPNWSCTGYMHSAVHGLQEAKGWAVHSWTTKNITSQPHLWKGALERKQQLGLADDDPEWLREGLGIWAKDTTRTVLPVDLWKATWDGKLPELIPSIDKSIMVRRRQQMIRQIGLDLGSTGVTAAVCIEYSLEEGIVRELQTKTLYDSEIDQMASVLKEMRANLNVTLPVVVDQGGLGELVSRQLMQRHGIPCIAAMKYDRDMQIKELRSACRTGKLFVIHGGELHKELSLLVYDIKAWERGIREIDPRVEDHRFDALRYVWWMAKAHLAQMPDVPESYEQKREREVREEQEKRLKPRKSIGSRSLHR